MTREGTAEGIKTDHETAQAPSVGALLDACDLVLREPGRRRHLFSWLRAPGAPQDGWLAVDAYYPASRLVAVIGAPDTPEHAVCRELVPPRGLRLLVLDPGRLPVERAGLEAELRQLIDELGPAPARAHEAPLPGERAGGPSITEVTVGRVVAAFSTEPPPVPPPPRRIGQSQAAATERGVRFVAAHKGRLQPAAGERPRPQGALARPAAARRPPAPAARIAPARRPAPVAPAGDRTAGTQPLAIVLGLVALAVVLAELYLAVGRIALAGGSVMLGFGVALDACARALGGVAAGRSGREDWAWWCVLGGSPAVAAFALYRPEGPVRVDPAPLAGLISLLAMTLIVISLVGALLGI
jgi:hypothetical protein